MLYRDLYGGANGQLTLEQIVGLLKLIVLVALDLHNAGKSTETSAVATPQQDEKAAHIDAWTGVIVHKILPRIGSYCGDEELFLTYNGALVA